MKNPILKNKYFKRFGDLWLVNFFERFYPHKNVVIESGYYNGLEIADGVNTVYYYGYVQDEVDLRLYEPFEGDTILNTADTPNEIPILFNGFKNGVSQNINEFIDAENNKHFVAKDGLFLQYEKGFKTTAEDGTLNILAVPVLADNGTTYDANPFTGAITPHDISQPSAEQLADYTNGRHSLFVNQGASDIDKHFKLTKISIR